MNGRAGWPVCVAPEPRRAGVRDRARNGRARRVMYSGPSKPLSFRQFLVVDLCLLAALAVHLNRDAILPQSLRPELRGSAVSWEMADAFNRPSAAAVRERIRARAPGELLLLGCPILVVGDSQAANWPLESDRIWDAAASPAEILAQLKDRIGDRRWDTAIVALGTAPIVFNDAIDVWWADAEAVVRLLSAHADRVVCLIPMPCELRFSGQPPAREVDLIADARQRFLALAGGNVMVWDPVTFYSTLPPDSFPRDRCHLSIPALALLIQTLQADGALPLGLNIS